MRFFDGVGSLASFRIIFTLKLACYRFLAPFVACIHFTAGLSVFLISFTLAKFECRSDSKVIRASVWMVTIEKLQDSVQIEPQKRPKCLLYYFEQLHKRRKTHLVDVAFFFALISCIAHVLFTCHRCKETLQKCLQTLLFVNYLTINLFTVELKFEGMTDYLNVLF